MTNTDLLFVFERHHSVELEGGYALAGNLCIDFPKSKGSEKEVPAWARKMTEAIIRYLMRMVETGQMKVRVCGWPQGRCPPNADDIMENDDLLEQWVKDRLVIGVRVHTRHGGLFADSELLRRTGLVSEH